MSTREMLYSVIDGLSEEQCQGLLMLLSGYNKKNTEPETVCGALSKYADPKLIPMEEGAWERTVTEKYENS